MISFRYHVVTIVAVFLALGLGVLAGTTVIDQQIVDGLRAQIVQANREVADLSDQVDALGSAQERQDTFIQSSTAPLIDGRLAGDQVVLITHEGVDPAAVQEVRTVLGESGADVVAGLSATGRLVSSDEAVRQSLTQLVGGSASDSGSDLSALAAEQLGRRLTEGATGERDILRDLLADGFLVSNGREGVGENDLPDIGGPGQTVVVVTGGDGEAVFPPDALLTPLTETLVEGGARVAVGESASSAYDGVVVLRDVATLDGSIVTVDNVDERLGGAALVRGLQQLQVTGEGGDFGSKRGADSLLPEG